MTPPHSSPPPTSAPPDVAPGDADEPARIAAARLFDELRDECSEVGITARGMNVAGLENGVRAYGREARRLGASAERTVILLKECLRDDRLASADRAAYDRMREAAVRWVIEAYFDVS